MPATITLPMEMSEITKYAVTAIVSVLAKEAITYAIKLSPTFAAWVKRNILYPLSYHWRLIPILFNIVLNVFFFVAVFLFHNHKENASVGFVMEMAMIVFILVSSNQNFQDGVLAYRNAVIKAVEARARKPAENAIK
jgi:hypothetical protein